MVDSHCRAAKSNGLAGCGVGTDASLEKYLADHVLASPKDDLFCLRPNKVK